MSESSIQQVLTALNLVVLERLDAKSFQIISSVPDWYSAFFPDLLEEAEQMPSESSDPLRPRHPIQSKRQLGSVFPFLENFLEDAESFWQRGDGQPFSPRSDRSVLKSGFWSEAHAEGQEFQLEATAICGNPHPMLLIESACGAYQEKQALIQTGRINELNYGQFAKETEKKEVLLHCIFHDMAGQLNTFRFCLELLKQESLSDRGRDRLEIGLRQVRQQEDLMREVLQAFSAEISQPQEVLNDPAQAPDLRVCAQAVASTFLPAFSLQNKQLQIQVELDPARSGQVIGERSRLERVMANLIENALRHTPEQSTVTLTIQEEEQFLYCAIEDQGEGVPPEAIGYLFQRFFQGKTKVGKAGLGLYFCRITVEQWGGAIGYSPTASGGAQFWLRLRKLL